MPESFTYEDAAEPSKAFSYEEALAQAGEQTSAGGAFGRSAVKGVLPSAAFGAGFGAVYPWATAALSETGPFAPLLGAIPAAAAGLVSSLAAGKVQGAAAEALAPETTKRFGELEAADVAQHPGA